MALLDLNSLLVLVEPEGDDAKIAFDFPENAECRRIGGASDALTGDDDDTASDYDLGLYLISPDTPTKVHLALSFNPGPKNLSKGFVFGSDPETCDVLLAKGKTSGISGNHFSINIDSHTLNPLITCLTSNDGAGIHILSDNVWLLKLQAESEVVEYGTTVTIRIFESMDFVVHSPRRDRREPAYSHNVEEYFRRCEDAVPEMTHLKMYVPDPTPLFVGRSRGLTGLEYFPTDTIVGKKIVLCVAKNCPRFPEDSQTFIIKRFRYVRRTWADHAKTILSQLRSLRHRHIIVPEDIISNGPDHMPVYLPEPPGTLTERLNSGSLGERDVGELLGQVFEGLKFLHAKGIVHGGLCPDSIRIESFRPWSIRLSDIGLHPQVILGNAEVRELYINEVRDHCLIPPPTGDIWSAGVIGLRVAWPTGFPTPSDNWPNEKNRALWSPLQWSRFQREWMHKVIDQAWALLHSRSPSTKGKRDVALFLTHVFTFANQLTAEQCLQDVWIQRWHLPLSHGPANENFQDVDDPYLYNPANDAGVPLAGPSGGGLVCEEAEDEADSGEEIETQEPRSSVSKGKQPQSRRPSVGPSSLQRQHCATPGFVNLRALQASPRESRESTVESSSSIESLQRYGLRLQ